MRVLIDTHILLWWLEDSKKLSSEVREVFLDGGSEIFVSVVSLWEIMIKKQLGKITFPHDDLALMIKEEGLVELQLQARHIGFLQKIPPIHSDPFDRMLIAQSKAEKLTFITHDKTIWQYDAKIMRA
jgi:PIN domain nuclease of toxin-antitoxin system